MKHQDLIKLNAIQLHELLASSDSRTRGAIYEACWRILFKTKKIYEDYDICDRYLNIIHINSIYEENIISGPDGGTDIYIKNKNNEYKFISVKFHINDSNNDILEDYSIDKIKLKNDLVVNNNIILCVNNKEQVKQKLINCSEKTKITTNHVFQVFGYDDLMNYWHTLNIPTFNFETTKKVFLLYPHQCYTYYKTLELFSKTNKVLYGHVMRSGKTYMAGYYIKEQKPNRILIITPLPVETIKQYEEIFKDYEGFEIYGNRAYLLKETSKDIIKSDYKIFIESKQFLDIHKFDDFGKFDLIISDENDFAGTTGKLNETINVLSNENTRYIYMTHTYAKTVFHKTFIDEAIINWTYQDIIDMKNKNIKNLAKYGELFNNILSMYPKYNEYYEKYPEPQLFTIRGISKYIEELLKNFQDEVHGYSMRTLLEMNETQTDFKNINQVHALLSLIFGSEKENYFRNCLTEKPIIQKIRETKVGKMMSIIYLPNGPGSFVKRADILKRYFNEIEELNQQYDVMIVSSENDNTDLKEDIENACDNSKKQGFIIIACGMLRRAITLKDLDCVILLNDLKSYDTYIQTIFRPMSENKSGKKYGYIVDLCEGRFLQYMDKACGGYIGHHNIDAVRNCIKLDVPNIQSNLLDENRINELIDSYQDFAINYKLDIIEGSILNKEDQLSEELKVLLTYKPNEDTERKFKIAVEKSSIMPRSGTKLIKKSRKEVIQKIVRRIINDDGIKHLFYLACRLIQFEEDINTYDILEILEYINKDEEIKNEYINIVIAKCPSFKNLDTLNLLIKLVKSIQLNERDNIKNLIELFREHIVNIDNPMDIYDFYIETLGDPNKREIKGFGEVYTPLNLIEEMLNKLPDWIWKNKYHTFFEPAAGLSPFILLCYLKLMNTLIDEIPDEDERRKWIIENMLYMNELQPKNISIIKKIYRADKYKVNIHEGDFLTANFADMKFTVILGNPPYQPPPGKDNEKQKATGAQIWPEFIRKSLNILYENGYMMMIHPAGWRKPGGRTSDLFDLLTKQNTMEYLEMHTNKGSDKIFDCGVKVDWYLLKKSKNLNTKLTYKDQKGIINSVDISNLSYLPNYNIDRIINLTNSPTKINFICDKNSYSTGNKKNKENNILSDVQDQNHPYILIHSTPKKGVVVKYSSINNRGLFGIPKIIFGDSGPHNPVIDLNGDYGMTEHTMAIALESKDLNEANFYYNILTSDDFFDILASVMWGNFQIDRFFMESLNKDFYKYIDVNKKLTTDIQEIDENSDINKQYIININTVKTLKELMSKYKIPGVTKVRKDNMDEYKNLLIQKLNL